MTERKSLVEELDKPNFEIALKELMKTRRVIDESTVQYGTIEHSCGNKKYTITATHVPIDYVFPYAKGSCKQCNSKGYQVINIEKHRIANPQDYVMLSNVPIQDMTEDEQRIWREKEKLNKFWRVMLPCRCAVTRALLKEPDILTNPDGSILLRTSYEVEEA